MVKKISDKRKIRSKNLFWVVGIGASAGGLEAFKQLIKDIPIDSGMAYILVQHLDPNHESMLVKILQKASTIPVSEIKDNEHVEPNHIYVIPSNKLLTASDGILNLSPRVSKTQRSMPIDVFFSSLAEVHQNQAIGVVLSGTGHDGTAGLKEIKQHGGFTFAQEPESAAFRDMPQSAIDEEAVDFVFEPAGIIKQLLGLNRVFKDHPLDGKVGDKKKEEILYKEILDLLELKKGVDFTYYKQTTIRRRIARRMLLKNVRKLDRYLKYLKTEDAEIDLLYQDILIPVTGFFRDTKVFEELGNAVLPLLAKNKMAGEPLRIWIVGCSSGQEAYSIGICIDEYIEQAKKRIKVQIFATDISEKIIQKARAGIYSEKEIEAISQERREKYFTKTDDGYQISRFIREMCIFANHNILANPPFAGMDLVSCRNVLIYMDAFLQRKAISAFHYALNERGILLLGKSESISNSSDLFDPVAEHQNIYVRKSVPGRFVHIASRLHDGGVIHKEDQKEHLLKDDFKKSADEFLLTKSPSGVVVNEQMEIVQFRGPTGEWLESPSGKPSVNILRMAKDSLAVDLRSVMHKVKTTRKSFMRKGISMKNGKMLNLEVIPLLTTINPYYLILFNNSDGVETNEKKNGGAKSNVQRKRTQQLEDELSQTREDFRIISENHETGNEELLSSNEELLSNSEELQSLNEELEISKEELQSTVEELSASNQELAVRNEELNQLKKYSEAIVMTIREPLIILDKDLRVRSANKSFYNAFNRKIKETEGRLFYEIENSQWDIPELRKMLEETLHESTFFENYEIQLKAGSMGQRIMLLNARRILAGDNIEHLVLLAIEDITERRMLEDKLKAAADQRLEEQEMFSGQLEKKVYVRTQQLNEVNSKLEQSNESLEQFAFIASHDLQEPLRKIKTYSNILTQEHSNGLAPEGMKLLEKIYGASERMSTLIQGVLDFSRVDSSERLFVNTDLNDIVNNVLDDFTLLIGEKSANIQTEKLPAIEVIPAQINQLFSNLISNSLKFTRNNLKPVISITSRNVRTEELSIHPSLNRALTYVEVIFADNGMGFEEKYSEKIFLIFQRLNSSKEFPGTGIGLALCKKIAINHHGDIFAKSEKHGASFHIMLPVRQQGIAPEKTKW